MKRRTSFSRKVVHRELADHPEHWLEMIRAAVLAALDRETIRLRVGPMLHRYLLEHLPAGGRPRPAMP